MWWKSKRDSERVVEEIWRKGIDETGVTYVGVVKKISSYGKILEWKETRCTVAGWKIKLGYTAARQYTAMH